MQPAELQPLFDAIRSAASSGAWSRGVELARAEAVCGEREDEGEIVLRVATRGGLISPAVTLFPADEEWDCECSSREDACEHAAAAIIALRRSAGSAQGLPQPARAGRIGYRLTREGSGLALERVVAAAGTETLLTTTLTAVASGRIDGPQFTARPADLAIERTLGAKRRGRVPRGILPTLLRQLSECDDIRLDGEPVKSSAEPVGRVAVLEDAGPGFRLRVTRDSSIEERFDDTVALCGDTLRPLAALGLTGREIADLGGGGRLIEPDQIADLVTQTLPELGKRMRVDVRTRRLPDTVREKPSLSLEIARDGDGLSALATLVYGDPPLARVDAGRLVPLGAGPVPLRDSDAEAGELRRLQQQLGLAPGHRTTLYGEDAVQLAERLQRFEGRVRGDAHEGFFRAPVLEPQLELGGGDFAVRFTAAVDGEPREANPASVLRAWRDGTSLVPLAGGGLAPLPADWLARFGDRVADLLAARGAAGALPRCMLPELAELCEELDAPAPPELEGLRTLLAGEGGLPAAELPADLDAELRGYQRRGIDWLCALRDAGLGALLADDMGLGKTLQALCALRGHSLVIAPTSVLHNWQREAERFRPGLRVCVYHGQGRRLDPDADLTLSTYAILRLDADALAGVAWDSVVLDEAQAIKNPTSQAARAAFRLRAEFTLALTGTPVENRLDELWSQLHFTNRGLLGGRRDFDERVAKPIAAGEAGAAERLRARIRPFVLRRLKREVAPELPPRTDIELEAELGEEERRLYEAVQAATRDEVVRALESGGSPLAALEALLRLRQAACHPALLPGQSAAGSAKVTLLVEMLDEALAEGHKALVFSQWTSLLDLVEPHLKEAELGFTRLDGSTRDRAGVVERFQREGGPPVLLCSLKAGGIGLNLTAADCVFILDPWWNPAAEDQAADRAHRIGQERPVMVYRLVARDTVEERILELQGRKRQLAEAALGDASGGAGLTREDLLALLG